MSTNILAIQGGHNSTAALLIDGKIIGCVSEERFTRIKNCSDFPLKSIKWLLNFANISPKDLDAVAFCGRTVILPSKNAKTPGIISKIYGHLEYKSGSVYGVLRKLKHFYDKKWGKKTLDEGKKILENHFGISEKKIVFIDHHMCHAYSTYFGQATDEKESLILTLDGEGDECCATVNVAKKGEITRIAETWKGYSLGYIYSLTTKFLGMTPLEHEYKVMGLAPYASSKGEKYFLKTYDKVFKDVIWLDKKNPLTFKSKFPTNRFELHLKKTCVGERFDNVAGALQYMTEELVKEWVRTAIKKTGISNIYAGGGVFMNVKMNMALAQMPEVKSLKVLPSCGDESNPIGAAYFTYLKICNEKSQTPNIEPIKDLYLGPGFDDEVENYIKKKKLDKKYDIRKADPKMVAELLAKGEVVARCVGRQEWGARSLGNRAIMANPSDLRYVWQINEQIKMRDFWMPFAPSILKERETDYIENPKKLPAPYMIMAFSSTQKARTELRAAMHQADFTLRPQLIERDWNPQYYDIIKEFEKLTGIGGILNTSFNLHGKPIVSTPKDAVEETFEPSGLKHLILGEYIISKRLTNNRV